MEGRWLMWGVWGVETWYMVEFMKFYFWVFPHHANFGDFNFYIHSVGKYFLVPGFALQVFGITHKKRDKLFSPQPSFTLSVNFIRSNFTSASFYLTQPHSFSLFLSLDLQ